MGKSKLVFVIFCLIVSGCKGNGGPGPDEETGSEEISQFQVQGGCTYAGGHLEGSFYSYGTDNDARSAVEDILSFTGLVLTDRNFAIRAANVGNAAAAITHGSNGKTVRLILYNQQWMKELAAQTRTNWSKISVLAHEIAHHLNAHTLDNEGSRPPAELQADWYSGFILQKMGATLEQAQAAMNLLPAAGSRTHPPRDARLAKIADGYIFAENPPKISPDDPIADLTPPPNPNPTPPPSPNPTSKPTTRCVFYGDPAIYLVMSDFTIVYVDNAGRLIPIGIAVSSSDPRFAWLYYIPNRVTYGVDRTGRIWTQDPLTGSWLQVGFLSAPS